MAGRRLVGEERVAIEVGIARSDSDEGIAVRILAQPAWTVVAEATLRVYRDAAP